MEDHEYRERLSRDVERWRRDEIISAEQARAILARQGAGHPSLVRALRMGWLVSAVSLGGALVLGAGVVLLFAANWEEMPDSFRTTIVFAGMAGAYGAAYWLMYRLDMQRTGSALLLLGALLYQAGIFLLAQIYNMPVNSPVLFLLGAIGGLPLAYLFGSRIVLLLSLAAIVAWQINAAAIRFEDRPDGDWSIFLLAGAFGIGLYAIGRLHLIRPALARLGEVYVLSGGLLALGVLYFATFSDAWDSQVGDGSPVQAAPASVFLVLALAAAVVAAELVFRWRDREDNLHVVAQVVLLATGTIAAIWPGWTGYALIFNAVFFAIAGAIVARGYVQGDERYVNFGLLAVGIGLVSRYIDTFWSLLAGSAFFIVGGLLLLILAFGIERARRELLRAMRDDDDDGNDGAPLPVEVRA
jgi:uncharacterized membrane protein